MSRQHGSSPESHERLRYNGIPAWVLMRYLVELGGRPIESSEPDLIVQGESWSARIRELPDRVVGSIRLASVEVTLRGDAATVATLAEALAVRTRRGGG